MPLSIDTNVLFAAVQATDANHEVASAFLRSIDHRQDVILSEFILLELYVLIRNPAVVAKPVSPAQAVAICAAFRTHPSWQVVSLPADSTDFHDTFWPRLAQESFARRRAYDMRTALSLIRHGVDEFATADVRDYADAGFKRVWNPLA